jgi:eukaryotic-like serine/threonine-protein kinase
VQPGQTIVQRFLIEREIGAGGMGTVFSARDLETKEKVAIKRLDIKTKNDSERFAREAVVLAELRHPGIVRYVAHGRTDSGEDFIAMEWLEGKTLADRLVEGPLSLLETVQLGSRVAAALGEAHKHNVVHRDIKPPNLFLPDGDIARVKLLDFGVARVTGLTATDSTMTRTGAVIGTPGYMAPEQARGEKELDSRADLFSLGSVLFQCLTGKAPFQGPNIMAVLAKILLEEAPRLREVRIDVPAPLDELIARMLAKEPSGRPQKVEEVAAALSAISFGDLESGSGTFPTIRDHDAPTKPPSLGDAEQRILCVVLAGDLTGTDDTYTPGAPSTGRKDLGTVVRELGGVLDPLVDGSVLVHFAGSGAATDLAAYGARCALAIRQFFADSPVVMATGRGEVSRRMPVGEVIDRAARTLETAPAGPHVRIDAVSAGLLELKFDVEADAAGWYLVREREGVTGVRTLLGKPTKLVGRDRELVTLEATFNEVAEEPVARAVMMTGAAGMGKSRLLHEFLKRTRAKDEPPLILGARGDVHRSSSAFGMLATALRREAGISEGEAIEGQRIKLAERVGLHLDPADRARVTAFLGELTNIAFNDDQYEGLRAARADAMLMGDAMRTAWLDWLGAELEQRPLLFILEELHECDLPTIRFVEAALKRFTDAPLMVLGLARPSVKERFPKLWSGTDPLEVNLGPLTKRATEKLIKQVLDVPQETVDLIIERGEGNPFIIEELVRAVAAGRGGELPDSVLGMVQARLDDLGPQAKRVLRAASVFGNTFWRGGILALLGGSDSTSSVSEWLDDLMQREIITRSLRSSFPGENEFNFGNATVRDAAYAMLTERDRKLGHRLAGQWLEASGQRDAIALASHFDKGGENDKAIGFYLRAAEQALEGNDFAAVISCAERGVALGAQLEMLGRLELTRAIAHYWSAEVESTIKAAEQASLHLPQGTAGWYRAVNEVLASLLRAGDVERLGEWIDRAASAPPAADGVNAQVICLARTAEHLLLLGHYDLSEKLFARVDEAASGKELEPLTLARVHRGRARRALHHGDPAAYANGLQAAYQTFEQAGDLRNACNERMNMGFALAELGEYEQARQALESARSAAEKMNLETVIGWADNNLGNVLSLSDLEQAKRVEQRAIDAGVEQGDPRLESGSRVYMSAILHRMGDHAGALKEAERAVELSENVVSLKTVALAAEARALLALGRIDQALEAAEEAMAHLETLGGLEEGEALVRLVYGEALDAADREEAAVAAIRTARDRLYARAARISNVAWRATFLDRVPDHARTLELAAALGLDDSPTLRD